MKEAAMEKRIRAFRKSLSRREFLKLSGTGMAGVALLGTASCGDGDRQNDGPATITFSHGPDTTGTMQTLIDQFNQENEGDIQVTHREMPADVTEYFNQLRTEFQAGGGDIDVIGGELAWVAQFAANGWLADLSDRFTEDMRSEYLPAPLETVTYQNSVYGVPWYTDAGMLFYRMDLLERSGFSEPPETWDELKEMAETVQQDAGTELGFVFQGADYEGGALNALEYIWNAGGEILDPGDATQVIIDSPESIEGLNIQRSMIEDGISPLSVTNYAEQDAFTAFVGGDAVFLRNWPYVYGILTDPEQSQIDPDQVGVAPIPVASRRLQSYSALGGWNLLINANSENQNAAWEFITFMTNPEQQKLRALEAGYLPTLQRLYDDQEIFDEVPVAALGREAIQNARPRPVSPFYQDMALVMSERFNACLRGNVTSEQTIQVLQEELQDIVDMA